MSDRSPNQSTQDATEVPQQADFTTRIQQEFIQGSKIAPDLFAASIAVVSDTEVLPGGDVAYSIHEALNWHVTRFGAKARENLEAALFKHEDGSTWQAKLSRSLQPGKKPYLAPKGKGSQAFTPAVTVRVWVKIAQRYNLLDKLPEWVKTARKNRNLTLTSGTHGFAIDLKQSSFWQWVRDNDIEIVLTEGGKKSLCLLSHGYVAIALYGVDGAGIFNEWIGGEKIRKLKPELIPDLQQFAVPGRKFILAFDRDPDSNRKAQQSVMRGISRTGKLLTDSGCSTTIATWDGRDGKGIDDLIVNCGIAAWEKSYAEAVSFTQWSIAHQLEREIRRKPDLNIGNREFVEVASDLPKSGIVALHGGKGSGKSKAIGQLTRVLKWLSITHRTSVGRDQGSGWGGVFVNDGDRHGSKLLKEGVPVEGGSVCVPSLLKVQAIEADVLVLDETTAILEFLLNSRLANKNGIRPLLLSEFERRVREAPFVLLADADLTEEALQYIELIRDERAYLVQSERKALTYEATVIDGSEAVALALLQEHLKQLPEGKMIYINSDSKTQANSLAELLGRHQTLLITGDTSGGEMETRFLASKGRDLPGLMLNGIRFIVSSPSVTQGFSIEHHTDLIHSVWGFYSGSSISAHEIAQAPDRVRDREVPRFFWIANKGSAYSKHSRAFTVPQFLQEFRQLKTMSARLVSHSLTPESASATDSIDWQNQNLKMFASLEVRRNWGMSALRETLIALLRKEGKRVKVIQPDLSPSEIQSAKTAMTEARCATHHRYCEAVAIATDITTEIAKVLENRVEALTPEERLSLTKYYLKEFYELETVTSPDVEFDRKGRTRTQIKRLEAVLCSDLATQRTARSMERNPETPQDWKPDAVESWLLEQSGAATLIRQIAAGEIEQLPSEQVQWIAGFVRSHSTEFRLAFNFRNVESLSDQQIVGEILSRHGIRTKRCGNKNNLRYEVCKPELEAVLAIIKRRNKGIAPPENKKINQRGAISQNVGENSASSTSDLSPEALADIRDLYECAPDAEAREEVLKLFSMEVWDQVFRQTA